MQFYNGQNARGSVTLCHVSKHLVSFSHALIGSRPGVGATLRTIVNSSIIGIYVVTK